ncbi:MAG: hypothetical protein ACJ71B_03945 [Nitrososphaera sp.]
MPNHNNYSCLNASPLEGSLSSIIVIALAAYSISAQSAIRIISDTDIVRHLTEEPHSVSTPVNQIRSKPMPRWCPNV